MATWELSCQSNPSSASDKELVPYLARQKAMREFFERALFVPQGTADKKLDRRGPVWSPHDIQ